MARPFTLEDARKLAISRSFALIIEKKVSELAMVEEVDFALVIGHLRALLATLDEMVEVESVQHGGGDCSNGYEFCEDGICRVWCS